MKDESQLVCIIDDDEIQHFLFVKSLEAQGRSERILSFFNVLEAISFLNQHIQESGLLPDIILLDLNMPLVDGWGFLQQYSLLKSQLKKQIKIFIISSSINQSEIARAVALPDVAGFISKPLPPQKLSMILS